MRGEPQVFGVYFWVFGFNKSPSPPAARLCAALSLQPKPSCFTSLHFNQSIHLCAKSPVNLFSPWWFFFFLTQCSVWFSILTKDGIRMMDVYLPAVWSPVLFLTAYRHHNHHRHILLIACSRSLIISPTGKKKITCQFLGGFLCFILVAQAISMPPHWCFLLGKDPVSGEPNSPLLLVFNLDKLRNIKHAVRIPRTCVRSIQGFCQFLDSFCANSIPNYASLLRPKLTWVLRLVLDGWKKTPNYSCFFLIWAGERGLISKPVPCKLRT